MGYAPQTAAVLACPACSTWSPVLTYRTVDVITGRTVRAVRCACGRTFDRNRDRPPPRVTDAGPAFGRGVSTPKDNPGSVSVR